MSSITGVSDLHNWAISFAESSAFAQAVKAAESTNSIHKLAKSFAESSAFAQAIKAAESTNSIHKLAKSFAGSSAFSQAIKALESTNSIQKWAKSFAGGRTYIQAPSGLYDAVERLTQAEYLDTLFDEIGKDISALDAGTSSSPVATDESCDAEELLMQLTSAESPNSFSNILGKCPGWLKYFLLHFLLYVSCQLILGATSGVLGNLITPHVEAYLQGTTAITQREKIKEIKKLSFSELGIELRSYRFVTTSTLAVRVKPNSKSAILDELRFGQVIGVLSIDRDWTEVVYEYGDGSTITGWVFTRYTTKFRR